MLKYLHGSASDRLREHHENEMLLGDGHVYIAPNIKATKNPNVNLNDPYPNFYWDDQTKDNVLFKIFANGGVGLSRRIVISGESGCGKSSLLSNIVKLWTSRLPWCSSFEFVFKIDLSVLLHDDWKLEYHSLRHKHFLQDNLFACLLHYCISDVHSSLKSIVDIDTHLESNNSNILLLVDNYSSKSVKHAEDLQIVLNRISSYQNVVLTTSETWGGLLVDTVPIDLTTRTTQCNHNSTTSSRPIQTYHFTLHGLDCKGQGDFITQYCNRTHISQQTAATKSTISEKSLDFLSPLKSRRVSQQGTTTDESPSVNSDAIRRIEDVVFGSRTPSDAVFRNPRHLALLCDLYLNSEDDHFISSLSNSITDRVDCSAEAIMTHLLEATVMNVMCCHVRRSEPSQALNDFTAALDFNAQLLTHPMVQYLQQLAFTLITSESHHRAIDSSLVVSLLTSFDALIIERLHPIATTSHQGLQGLRISPLMGSLHSLSHVSTKHNVSSCERSLELVLKLNILNVVDKTHYSFANGSLWAYLAASHMFTQLCRPGSSDPIKATTKQTISQYFDDSRFSHVFRFLDGLVQQYALKATTGGDDKAALICDYWQSVTNNENTIRVSGNRLLLLALTLLPSAELIRAQLIVSLTAGHAQWHSILTTICEYAHQTVTSDVFKHKELLLCVPTSISHLICSDHTAHQLSGSVERSLFSLLLGKIAAKQQYNRRHSVCRSNSGHSSKNQPYSSKHGSSVAQSVSSSETSADDGGSYVVCNMFECVDALQVLASLKEKQSATSISTRSTSTATTTSSKTSAGLSPLRRASSSHMLVRQSSRLSPVRSANNLTDLLDSTNPSGERLVDAVVLAVTALYNHYLDNIESVGHSSEILENCLVTLRCIAPNDRVVTCLIASNLNASSNIASITLMSLRVVDRSMYSQPVVDSLLHNLYFCSDSLVLLATIEALGRLHQEVARRPVVDSVIKALVHCVTRITRNASSRDDIVTSCAALLVYFDQSVDQLTTQMISVVQSVNYLHLANDHSTMNDTRVKAMGNAVKLLVNLWSVESVVSSAPKTGGGMHSTSGLNLHSTSAHNLSDKLCHSDKHVIGASAVPHSSAGIEHLLFSAIQELLSVRDILSEQHGQNLSTQSPPCIMDTHVELFASRLPGSTNDRPRCEMASEGCQFVNALLVEFVTGLGGIGSTPSSVELLVSIVRREELSGAQKASTKSGGQQQSSHNAHLLNTTILSLPAICARRPELIAVSLFTSLIDIVLRHPASLCVYSQLLSELAFHYPKHSAQQIALRNEVIFNNLQMNHTDSAVRVACLRLVGLVAERCEQFITADIVLLVVNKITDSHSLVREACVEVLLLFKGIAKTHGSAPLLSAEFLMSHLDIANPNWQVRRSAMRTLCALALPFPKLLSMDVISILEMTLSVEEDSLVKAVVIQILTACLQVGKGFSSFTVNILRDNIQTRDYLQSENFEIRRETLKYIAVLASVTPEMITSEVVQTVIQSVNDSHSDVGEVAIETLLSVARHCIDLVCFDKSLRLFKHSDSNYVIRSAYLKIVSLVAEKQPSFITSSAVRIVMCMSLDEHSIVRVHAHHALSDLCIHCPNLLKTVDFMRTLTQGLEVHGSDDEQVALLDGLERLIKKSTREEKAVEKTDSTDSLSVESRSDDLPDIPRSLISSEVVTQVISKLHSSHCAVSTRTVHTLSLIARYNPKLVDFSLLLSLTRLTDSSSTVRSVSLSLVSLVAEHAPHLISSTAVQWVLRTLFEFYSDIRSNATDCLTIIAQCCPQHCEPILLNLHRDFSFIPHVTDRIAISTGYHSSDFVHILLHTLASTNPHIRSQAVTVLEISRISHFDITTAIREMLGSDSNNNSYRHRVAHFERIVLVLQAVFKENADFNLLLEKELNEAKIVASYHKHSALQFSEDIQIAESLLWDETLYAIVRYNMDVKLVKPSGVGISGHPHRLLVVVNDTSYPLQTSVEPAVLTMNRFCLALQAEHEKQSVSFLAGPEQISHSVCSAFKQDALPQLSLLSWTCSILCESTAHNTETGNYLLVFERRTMFSERLIHVVRIRNGALTGGEACFLSDDDIASRNKLFDQTTVDLARHFVVTFSLKDSEKDRLLAALHRVMSVDSYGSFGRATLFELVVATAPSLADCPALCALERGWGDFVSASHFTILQLTTFPSEALCTSVSLITHGDLILTTDKLAIRDEDILPEGEQTDAAVNIAKLTLLKTKQALCGAQIPLSTNPNHEIYFAYRLTLLVSAYLLTFRTCHVAVYASDEDCETIATALSLELIFRDAFSTIEGEKGENVFGVSKSLLEDLRESIGVGGVSMMRDVVLMVRDIVGRGE